MRFSAPAVRAGFVGREQSLGELGAACGPGQTVVLVGPPGVGKTRLAIAFVSDRSHRFCALAEATTAAEFLVRVAEVLAIEVPPDTSREALAAQIEQRLREPGLGLLVLDSVEQLPGEVDAWIGAWHAAEGMLVTTRRRPGSERVVTVALPPLSVERRPGEARSEAARMLAERARVVTGGAFDEEAQGELLEQLGRHLDGLPLALELAAARLRVLAPPQVLARLSERFRVLRRPDDAGEQGDLWESIASSFALLTPPAQDALLAASVFRGGFTLEAAEAVLAQPGAPWTLDLLESLLDQSLLTVDDDPDERRYDLLLCIREFAAQQATQRPALLAEAEGRHAAHHAALAAALRPRNDQAARRQLERERANLGAVVERGTRVGAARALEAALALASPAGALPYAAAEAHLSAALALADEPDAAELRNQSFHARGTLRRHLGRLDEATDDLREAATRAAARGDRALEAEALAGLGNNAAVRADWTTMRSYLQRALDLHPAPRFRALALTMLANSHCNEDDHEQAERLFRQALARAIDLGDEPTAAITRLALGVLRLEVGDLGDAVGLLTLALEEQQRLGAPHWEGVALTYLARCRQESGDLAGALTLYPQGLVRIARAGVRRAEAVASYQFATALLEAGELSAAAERLHLAQPLVRATCQDHEGLVLAAHGVVAARRGAVEVATRLYDQAEQALGRHRRPTFQAAVRALRGHAPDQGLEACAEVRMAVRLRVPGLVSAPSLPPLLVARDGSWFRAPGSLASVDLGRRRALRGVLAALSHQRHTRPGEAVEREALIRAGWGDERIDPAAALERVYAAVATLRRLGLRGVLLQKADGYLLSPSCPLVLG